MNGNVNASNAITVGVLSDTHGRFFGALYAAFADCQHIIHAGDIGSPYILRDLETLAPVTAVLGNNDFREYGDSVGRTAKISIGGLRFFISHYPEEVDFKKNGRNHYASGEPLPHICIHGHTHVPRMITGFDARPTDMILCPGSPVHPRLGSKPQIAKIEIAESKILRTWFEDV